MGIQRLENVGIVVDDLDAVTRFFVDLGLEQIGTAEVQGEWCEQVVGLAGNHAEIVMLQTPDKRGRLELIHYLHPDARPGLTDPAANVLGLHRVAFVVDDIDAAVETAARHGGAPLDRIGQYEDQFRLCYLRGPEGIVVMLAEELQAAEES